MWYGTCRIITTKETKFVMQYHRYFRHHHLRAIFLIQRHASPFTMVTTPAAPAAATVPITPITSTVSAFQISPGVIHPHLTAVNRPFLMENSRNATRKQRGRGERVFRGKVAGNDCETSGKAEHAHSRMMIRDSERETTLRAMKNARRSLEE
ncbi:hypothetical protein K440DRAFT_639406 [Wilcoxina mikolae CBS 423.85]|nr:hypothetical protein K440DRAFT_639406 [Wilcoxina mikolae CBS 423.85]